MYLFQDGFWQKEENPRLKTSFVTLLKSMEGSFLSHFILLYHYSILTKVRNPFCILSFLQLSFLAGGSYIQIFQWPNLRKKALICYWLWFSTGLIYYGLTLNSNTLGTELFTTFSIGKVKNFWFLISKIFLTHFSFLSSQL